MIKRVRKNVGQNIPHPEKVNSSGHPVVGVGALVIHEKRVLLVKRRNPPAKNQWAIPGGKVNFGETLQKAAEREILEETGIVIEAGRPLLVFDVIQTKATGFYLYHYVIIDLEGWYVRGEVCSGDDALEAAWFDQDGLSKLNLNENTKKLLANYYELEP